MPAYNDKEAQNLNELKSELRRDSHSLDHRSTSFLSIGARGAPSVESYKKYELRAQQRANDIAQSRQAKSYTEAAASAVLPEIDDHVIAKAPDSSTVIKGWVRPENTNSNVQENASAQAEPEYLAAPARKSLFSWLW